MNFEGASFREGDLVAIPLPSGLYALARVVHVSIRYKDAIGVVIYRLIDRTARKSDGIEVESRPILGPLYTNIKAAIHYGWETLRHEELSAEDRMLSKRIVGGGICVGDEYVRPATIEDERNLPEMLAYGMPGIYREIEKAFGTGNKK